MSKETLENWIKGVENCNNPIEIVENFGVYNDLFFYFKVNNSQREQLIDLLNSNPQFNEIFRKKQVENFYKTDREDKVLFRTECENQYLITFANKGITFDHRCSLPMSGNEVGFNYSGKIQLGLFGDYFGAAEELSVITREFILPERIPVYVITANCRDEKFSRFSAFIND